MNFKFMFQKIIVVIHNYMKNLIIIIYKMTAITISIFIFKNTSKLFRKKQRNILYLYYIFTKYL